MMKRPVEKSSAKWEETCCRCGRCCYEKIDFEGQIYYTDIPCQFLDTAAKLCRVYAERDSRRPGCVRLNPETVARGFLPADCPYVAGLDAYPAPVMPDESGPERS
jgi:uncharacterized cysteine cluster protein YcgN (CxxCxxCC family)